MCAFQKLQGILKGKKLKSLKFEETEQTSKLDLDAAVVLELLDQEFKKIL